MGDMAIPAGGGILLPFHQGLGVCSFEITLVFLWMTPFTFFVIVKECRGSTQEFLIRMFYPFLFNI
jgi:hypothetical protein